MQIFHHLYSGYLRQAWKVLPRSKTQIDSKTIRHRFLHIIPTQSKHRQLFINRGRGIRVREWNVEHSGKSLRPCYVRTNEDIGKEGGSQMRW